MAKCQSTNTSTFLTIAFGTGHIATMRIAVVATKAHAVGTPTGPAFLISKEIVTPIMQLIAMTYALR
jgi:hypothetical protein